MTYVQELRELYEGIESRLTDREIRIFDLLKYVSNCQSDVDRQKMIKHLKRGEGPDLIGSTYVTNLKVNNAIPNLEIREINNIVKKLEMWGMLHIPRFGIPFFSMRIYGSPEPKAWLFFGEIYEATFQEIKKHSFVFMNHIFSQA